MLYIYAGITRTGLGHLVVHLAECGCHLVRERTGDNHDVALTRGSTEDNTQSVLVVPRSSHVHHLYSAACETYKRWSQK